MNPAVKFAMDTKAKFGVTFTKHMSLKDLVAAWDRVPDNIKQNAGGVGVIISSLSTLLTTQQLLREATVKATEVYNKTSKAIELASIPQGSTQTIPLTAASLAKLAEEEVNEQVNSAPEIILSKLSEQV